MKRTPMVRKAPLRRSAIAPGTVPPRADRPRVQRPGRPAAERLAGHPAKGNPIPAATRTAVRERSGGRCEIRSWVCTGQATEQHHRRRRRDGGHSLGNLLDTCSDCHRTAHAEPAYARQRGWIVSAFEADPASVPVHYGPATTWFHDDGTKTTDVGPTSTEGVL